MSVREIFAQRVDELKSAVDQSLANHNALIGRFHEAVHLLDRFDKAAHEVDDVIQSIEEAAQV